MGTWRSGVYRYRDGGVTQVEWPFRDEEIVVRSMAVSPGGELWISSWAGMTGLFRVRPGGAHPTAAAR
jgi:hypothetical protein